MGDVRDVFRLSYSHHDQFGEPVSFIELRFPPENHHAKKLVKIVPQVVLIEKHVMGNESAEIRDSFSCRS